MKVQNQSVLQRFFRLFSAFSMIFLLLLGASVEGAGQIAQRGTATTATGTGTSIAINKPSGIIAGDVMIVNITQTGNTTTNASLPGWTIISGGRLGTSGNGPRYTTILYRVANGSEGSSFVFTLGTGSTSSVGSIIAFSGVASSVFDVIPGSLNMAEGTSITVPEITTATNNAAVLFLAGAGGTDTDVYSAWSGSTPTLTEIMDFSNSSVTSSVGAAWGILTTAGNTGDKTVTVDGNYYCGGMLIALKPAPIPGSTISAIYNYTGSNQTFTVPNCVTNLTIEAWGGGGGGYDGNNNGGGKGGGGGGYAKGTIINPSGTYNIVVGAGGTSGNNGSASTFGGTTVVADYGRGGTSATNGGGTGGTSNIGNVTTSNGGNGGNGNNNSDGGGGGGGAGGPDGNGINGSNATNFVGGAGGAGDDGSGGSGGAGGNSSVGVAGTANALGGGGGGGGDNGTAGGGGGFPGAGGGGGENGGGAGGNGQIKVTYVLPNNPTISLSSTTASACYNATSQDLTLAYSGTTGCPDNYSIDFASGITDVMDAPLSESPIIISVPAGLSIGTYTGTLTVKNSNYNFVSGNYSISVTIYASPYAPTTSDANICIGSTATLSASGAASGQVYKWYNASSGGSLLKTSASDTDNTFSTPVLTATTSYWVSIQNTSTGCESERIQITATFPSVSSDSQTRAGADTWIGHVYKRTDGTAGAPTDANAFTNYYGIITESEIFNESFGGTNFCLPLTANESTRSIYTEYFAVRYRMNSSKEGIYVAHMGSDDGVRLTVDGTKVYDRWIERGYTVDTVVLFKLSGTSNLLLEYYESAGGNQISFQNLSKVSNNLTSGTTQKICSSSIGSQISGNNVFTDPPIGSRAIFTVSYQWQQSTDQNIWSDISGATSQNYTPSGFLEGTYYIRRKLTVSRTNPGSIVVSAIDYSNIATLTVRPVFAAGTIANTGQTICSGTVPTTQIGSTADAGGGDNTITYQWQYSTDNTFSTGVSTVASNTATYIPTQALTQTTYYRRQAKDGTCNTMFTSSSGVWSVTVNPLPTANISGDNSPLCAGDDAVFNLTGTAGAVVTYKVNSGSDQTITLTGGVATISINNVTDDQVLTLVSVTNGTCSQNLNATETITVNPLPEIGSFN